MAALAAAAIGAHAAGPVDLATFARTGDPAVDRCYDIAAKATAQGKALCNERGFGDYWACEPGKASRLAALDECDAMSASAQDQPAMLYLRGLLYVDFRQQAGNASACPRFYRFQEGSAVCVYENAHFDRLLARFPDSRFADMAWYRIAEGEYRYYECEGSVACGVENAIAGWIEFLDRRPRSPYAGIVTGHVVAALAKLSEPDSRTVRVDNAGSLARDLDRLAAIARKLSAEDRAKLSKSVANARRVIK